MDNMKGTGGNKPAGVNETSHQQEPADAPSAKTDDGKQVKVKTSSQQTFDTNEGDAPANATGKNIAARKVQPIVTGETIIARGVALHKLRMQRKYEPKGDELKRIEALKAEISGDNTVSRNNRNSSTPGDRGSITLDDNMPDFSDSAPLLGQQQHLTRGIESDHATSSPAYHPQRDKEGNIIYAPEQTVVSVKTGQKRGFPEETQTNVVTGLASLPQDDLKKPIYGRDVNTRTDIDRKKIQQYRVSPYLRGFKHLLGKAATSLQDKYHQTLNKIKMRRRSAKIQYTVERMQHSDSPSVFHTSVQDKAFFTLFRDVALEKYKNNANGLKHVHDLLKETLTSHIQFTEKEQQNGYIDAMATLVMAGAGLIDTNDNRGKNKKPYSSFFENPTEQKADFFASLKEGKNTGKKRLTLKNLQKAGDIIAKAAQQRQEARAANNSLLADPWMADPWVTEKDKGKKIRDADEVAKQTLIATVMTGSAGYIPDDIENKLEIMRGNWSSLLAADDALTEPEAKSSEAERIKILTDEIAGLQKLQGTKTSQSSELRLQPEDQKTKVQNTRESLTDILSQTRILDEDVKTLIINSILYNCRISMSSPHDKDELINLHETTSGPIQPEQIAIAEELAGKIADYVNQGGSTAAGVYQLLTASPPYTEGGIPSDLSENSPPHPLHATELKTVLTSIMDDRDRRLPRGRQLPRT